MHFLDFFGDQYCSILSTFTCLRVAGAKLYFLHSFLSLLPLIFFGFISKFKKCSLKNLRSEKLEFFVTCITVYMVIRMGKVQISKFKSLKAIEKGCLLFAMNFKSSDITLLYAPLFNLISFKSIGIIKKECPMVLDTLLKA